MNGFEDAWERTVELEGGFTVDNGGETMYGVTKAVARASGYMGDMRELTLEQAKQIAKRKYWDLNMCDQFHPAIAFQVFDAAYNGGKPIKWLQRAVGVKEDGIVGAVTIAAVRTADVDRTVRRFLSYRLSYMTGLGVWKDYGKGWARRIAANLLAE